MLVENIEFGYGEDHVHVYNHSGAQWNPRKSQGIAEGIGTTGQDDEVAFALSRTSYSNFAFHYDG